MRFRHPKCLFHSKDSLTSPWISGSWTEFHSLSWVLVLKPGPCEQCRFTLMAGGGQRTALQSSWKLLQERAPGEVCSKVLLQSGKETGFLSPYHHRASQLCSCRSFHLFLGINSHFLCPILFSTYLCTIIRPLLFCVLSTQIISSKWCLNNIWKNMYIQIICVSLSCKNLVLGNPTLKIDANL